MKKILLFVLVTFFVQTTFCQNLADTVNVEYSKNSPDISSFGFGVPTGSTFWLLDAPNLNSFLRTYDISRRDAFLLSIPLSYIYQFRRLKYELNYHYFINYGSTSSKQFSQLNLGYAIFAERNYFIYINLGIGYGRSSEKIDIPSFTKPLVSLASVFQSGVGQSITLDNKTAFIDFSIETMHRFKKVNSLGQSFKLGIHYGLEATPWTSTSVRLIDSPLDRVSGFYFQYSLNISRTKNPKRNAQNSPKQ